MLSFMDRQRGPFSATRCIERVVTHFLWVKWSTVLAFLQGVSVAASPVLATIGMSVRLSVRLSVYHTLALSENDAS